MIQENIWLIGTGQMAVDYGRVLHALNCKYMVIGRGTDNCAKYYETLKTKPIEGGLKTFLSSTPSNPQAAIVSVGIESLSEITAELLNYGVKYILLEKPGVGYADEIKNVTALAKKYNATIVLAYNRRFYSSVRKAKQLIEEDGGVTSFNFEFTEWSHVIRTLVKHKTEHNNWFLGNSTHVIDTAFYLGGKPRQLCAFVKGGIDWHPSSSIFSGAGEAESGALFSYHANWESPGRWVLELLTKKRRLIFKPLETLQVQEIGSVAVNPVLIDDSLDKQFKPGLYLQTKAFLEKDLTDFCDVFEQAEMIDNHYRKMSGY